MLLVATYVTRVWEQIGKDSKAFCEKFTCKFSSLFETIHAFVYFHVNPSIAIHQVMKVVLFSDIIGDDGNVEVHVLTLVKGSAKLVIF